MDYRQSHLEKGNDYHDLFESNARRSLIWNFEKRILEQIYFKYFKKKKDLAHLDFACGTGRIINFLSNFFSTSVGVDVSDNMLEVAKKNAGPHSMFLNVDLTSEKHLNDKKFDLITAFRFFPNAQEDLRNATAKTLIGLLKNEGLLVANLHTNYGSIRLRIFRFLRFFSKVKAPDFGVSMNEFEKNFTDNGFEIVEKVGVGIFPETEERIFPIRSLVKFFETFCMKLPVLVPYSENIIYLFKKKSG